MLCNLFSLVYYIFLVVLSFLTGMAETLVQWLKLPAWKVGDRAFEPHSGLQVSKKQNVSSALTQKDSIMWGSAVTER